MSRIFDQYALCCKGVMAFSYLSNVTVSRTYALSGETQLNFSATVDPWSFSFANTGNIEMIFLNSSNIQVGSTFTSSTITQNASPQDVSLSNVMVPSGATQVKAVFRQVTQANNWGGNYGIKFSNPSLTGVAGIVPTLNTGTDVTVQTSSAGGQAGNITVSALIASTGASAGALSLIAHNDIYLNAGISLSGTGKALLVKAGRSIVQSSSSNITTNGGSVTLWANSDGDATDAGGGYIFIDGNSSSSLTTINTNGGHLWLGGGSGSTTWNGLTVGSDYAVGNSTDTNGIFLRGTTINTGGGNIALYGKSRAGAAVGGEASGNVNSGIRLSSGSGANVSINSGTGSILFDGVGRGTSGWAAAIEVSGYSGAVHTITSAATSGTAITITGNGSLISSSTSKTGVWIHPATTISATGGGGISITGTGGGPPQGIITRLSGAPVQQGHQSMPAVGI